MEGEEMSKAKEIRELLEKVREIHISLIASERSETLKEVREIVKEWAKDCNSTIVIHEFNNLFAKLNELEK